LTVATTSKSLEEIAQSALTATKGTPSETKAASISGFPGRAYSWTYLNSSGIKLHTTMILIQLEGGWLVSCTKLEVDCNSPTEHRHADTVMQTVKLTKGGR